MKTLTEFSTLTLRRAAEARAAFRASNKGTPTQAPEPVVEAASEAPPEGAEGAVDATEGSEAAPAETPAPAAEPGKSSPADAGKASEPEKASEADDLMKAFGGGKK